MKLVAYMHNEQKDQPIERSLLMPTAKEDLDAVLDKVAARLGLSTDPRDRPHQYIRDIYTKWKSGGGALGGKPRHSDRYLDEMLKDKGMVVRSLTPKLASGRTNIKANDGAVLMNFFLSTWPEFVTPDGSEIRYVSILPKHDVNRISAYIEARLDAHDDGLPEDIDRLPGIDAALVLTDHFEQSDAIVTVAPEHVLIASRPKRELIGFRSAVDSLWAIEKRDGRPRPLIWVLDLGDQKFEDESSRKKYLNVQALIARFKALQRFREQETEARFDWLCSRAVIVLLDTASDSAAAAARRPSFAAHHASLTTVASDWLASVEFRALYGTKLERLDQRNFSVFFKKDGWPDSGHDLKFYGYAQFAIDEEKEEYSARAIELPELPARYLLAFRNVCAAAYLALGIENIVANVDENDATNNLRYLGYDVLLLKEFLLRY